jgi:hypothetical protein
MQRASRSISDSGGRINNPPQVDNLHHKVPAASHYNWNGAGKFWIVNHEGRGTRTSSGVFESASQMLFLDRHLATLLSGRQWMSSDLNECYGAGYYGHLRHALSGRIDDGI